MFYALLNSIKELDNATQRLIANFSDLTRRLNNIDYGVANIENQNAKLNKTADAQILEIAQIENKLNKLGIK